MYLTIPQKCSNTANMYIFLNSRFVPYQNLSSPTVEHVTSFHIGPRSFLAIGGQQPAIYKFTKTGIKQEITDIHLKEVKYFLPVPINNYRQDVLLLAQQDLDHSTHISNVVKIFLYANGVFNAHDEVPCRAFGEETHGVTCIVDDERDHGIFGAAVVSLGPILGVVVPTHQMHTALFMFNTSLVEVEHPIVSKMKTIMDEKNRLQVSLTTYVYRARSWRGVESLSTVPHSYKNTYFEKLIKP